MPKKILFAFLAVLFAAQPFYLQAAEYDRYGSVYKDGVPPSDDSDVATDFLTYPFAILKWPISKTLVFIEKKHIDTKAEWAYDSLINRGITPHLGLVNPVSGHYGLEVDWVRLLNQRNRFPDWKANSWIYGSKDIYFQTGSEIGWQDVTGSGIGASGLVQYENRPEVHFSGIGPHSSAGNGTSYKMETTTLGPKLSYDPKPTVSGDLFFHYKNINITNGEDGGRGIIDNIFAGQNIPGLAGDEILTLGTEWVHDTRNHRELSTRGGERRFAFSYNEGIAGSEARYFKYETEVSQYFRLGSDRRALALHFYGEHNDEINNGEVPFHQMAMLGGYAGRPRISQTLRGYDYNRFYDESAVLFNVEYRYAIWENREFRVDSVLFWDQGQVFGEFGELEFDNFKESYGIGFRLSVANVVLLSIEGAHGDEGTNYYVKSRTPF